MSYKILVLNLKRRIDRKNYIINLFNNENIENYEFYLAYDGLQLDLNLEIKNLFLYNDFNNRKNIIGCALSHYNIWLDLIKESDTNFYIIFEDDITLKENFIKYLNDISHIVYKKLNNIDILLLGYSRYEKENQNDNHLMDYINLNDFNRNNFVGGTYGYIITKNGAQKLINYIENNGIRHGIDYLFKIILNLNIYEISPPIVFTEWFKNINDKVDTDIQNNFETFDFNIINDYYNYRFINGKDHLNDDIFFKNNLTIDELMKISNEKEEVLAFNTLGFFKNKIDNLQISNYYSKSNDGIYIKLDNIIKVKMICNWTNSKNLCDQWNIMSKGNYKWNKIKIVSDNDNIDYYVIINMPINDKEEYIPNKTIIFQMEPKCNNENQNWGTKTWGKWAEPDSNDFLEVRNHSKFYNNCTWNINIDYNYLNNNFIKKKYNYISTICSSKYFDPGHIKRIDFLKFIENKNNSLFKMDIYGYDNDHQFINYKGSLSDESKLMGIIPYKYYFMAENNSEFNYITEKFWEPLISECLCFYWGAPNISDYIDANAFVLLDLDDFEKSYHIINNAINNNLWEERINIIRKEKYKILNYYNFFPTIERIITKDIWKDRLDILKNFKIYIIQTEENKINQISNVLIDTFKYFNISIEIFNTYIKSNLIEEPIVNNQNLKKLIYNNNEIKYANINENGISIFNQIRLFEKIILDNFNFNNYLVLLDNSELNCSINNLFNHLFYLPENYDVCSLIISNPKIINQVNPLYYIVKKYFFKSYIPYFISKKGCLKILKYINNILSIKEEDLMYKCYNDIPDFNFYCSKFLP